MDLSFGVHCWFIVELKRPWSSSPLIRLVRTLSSLEPELASSYAEKSLAYSSGCHFAFLCFSPWSLNWSRRHLNYFSDFGVLSVLVMLSLCIARLTKILTQSHAFRFLSHRRHLISEFHLWAVVITDFINTICNKLFITQDLLANVTFKRCITQFNHHKVTSLFVCDSHMVRLPHLMQITNKWSNPMEEFRHASSKDKVIFWWL